MAPGASVAFGARGALVVLEASGAVLWVGVAGLAVPEDSHLAAPPVACTPLSQVQVKSLRLVRDWFGSLHI